MLTNKIFNASALDEACYVEYLLTLKFCYAY